MNIENEVKYILKGQAIYGQQMQEILAEKAILVHSIKQFYLASLTNAETRLRITQVLDTVIPSNIIASDHVGVLSSIETMVKSPCFLKSRAFINLTTKLPTTNVNSRIELEQDIKDVDSAIDCIRGCSYPITGVEKTRYTTHTIISPKKSPLVITFDYFKKLPETMFPSITNQPIFLVEALS